eukprot:NODE_93_length_21530_cov_0.700387.p1 type:complete len:856 gc:universal NODE_93_length_21530_cov_0.700387:10147-12714(+)
MYTLEPHCRLPTKAKPIKLSLPSFKITQDVVDHILKYDYSEIPIQKFQNTQYFPDTPEIAKEFSQTISEVFHECQFAQDSDVQSSCRKIRLSNISETFENTMLSHSSDNTEPARKRQKLIAVDLSSKKLLMDLESRDFDWDSLNITEINVICQEMIQTNADVKVLLKGMLRLIGNVNLSWFYKSKTKLPLYVYEQLLPLDDKILNILLEHYPRETDSCIYYILQNVKDLHRQLMLLITCVNANQEAVAEVVKQLLQDIILNKNFIANLICEAYKNSHIVELPNSNSLLKQLLHGLCLYSKNMKDFKIKSAWTDIVFNALSPITPQYGPTELNIDVFPKNTLSLWESILGPDFKFSEAEMSSQNLPDCIFQIVLLPCIKLLLKPILDIKSSNQIQLRTKATKLLKLCCKLLKGDLKDKLIMVLVNMTKDASPLVRDVALEACLHYSLNENMTRLCLERLNDTSLKVRKTAIKFANELYNQNGNPLACALILKAVLDDDIQPLILKTVKNMLLLQIPITKSYLQLNEKEKSQVIKKSSLISECLVYLYKNKNSDPTIYLKTFYENVKGNQVDLFFQLTVDCMMDKGIDLVYCNVLSNINPKWCLVYKNELLKRLFADNDDQGVVISLLQILSNLFEFDSSLDKEFENQMVTALLDFIQYGSAPVIEHGLKITSCIISIVGELEVSRIQGLLEMFLTNAQHSFQMRDALVSGLTMRYSQLAEMLPMKESEMASLFESWIPINEHIARRALCDLCLGFPKYMLVLELNCDTAVNSEMCLKCILNFFQNEKSNALQILTVDEIDNDVVIMLNKYFPLLNQISQNFISELRIFELLSQILFICINQSMIHPKQVISFHSGL